MKKFIAIYMGAETSTRMDQWNALEESARKKREMAGIEAWMNWAQEHSRSILDGGAPLGKTKRVDVNGLSDMKNLMTGYVIVEADSHEAAARMFVHHPHFSHFPGESVEIMECLPLPGMA